RLRSRVDRTAERWTGRGGGSVRPLVVSAADPRILNGAGPWWSPWQEGIGVRGLDAVGQVLDYEPARDLAWLAGRSLVQHGFRGTEPDYAVLWVGRDRTGARQGGGFGDWTWPAVKVVQREAAFRFDAETAQRAEALDEGQKAKPQTWRRREWGAVR
ncbi:MAG: hypothetical protein VW362_12230, partial [Candidatus Nanopelagicales bacterium]